MTPRPRPTPTGWRALLQPAILPVYATSAARSLRRGWLGPHRFAGEAEQICRAVVEACWDGHRLAASTGHFRQFWMRDVGFSAAALVRLGYRDRVEASLAWALEAWGPRGWVTTTVFPPRRPADVYAPGIDSLPWLLHALRVSEADDLVTHHAHWLGPAVERYGREVLDPRTGLVRADRRFSAHRDTIRLGSNCYANTMVALLSQTLRETDWLRDPVPPGAADRLVDAFWRGDHFSESARIDETAGDASLWPFFCRVVGPELGRATALRWLASQGYADPIPLRYALRRDRAVADPIQRTFVPDYQGTAIWTSLGSIYLALLLAEDPARAAPGIDAYRQIVERDGTFWEVLVVTGKSSAAQPAVSPIGVLRPYRGRLGIFHADEAMLWSAIFLDLLKRPASGPS